MSDQQAPFIPSGRRPRPDTAGAVARVSAPGFLPLFGAQFVSSLGDWTGLFAISRSRPRVQLRGTAVGLVMVARMLPGFLFAPLGGALIDRWNRKVVMVACDIGRGGLLALLPFWDEHLGSRGLVVPDRDAHAALGYRPRTRAFPTS